jgi:sodium/bile acid cotransporter 7
MTVGLLKHWFLIAIVLSILLSYHYSWIGIQDGPISPELTVKILAVSLIFFLSGLGLKTSDLKSALYQWRLHLVIQGYSLVVTPILVLVLVMVLPIFSHDTALTTG